MTLLLAVVLLFLIGWVARRFSETDRDLTRLMREVDDLRTRLRGLQEQQPATPESRAPSIPPLPSPIAPVEPAAPSPREPDVFTPQASIAGAATIPDEEDTGVVERAIGERWLLYAGVIVLLLAVVFFLRYAFERDWLSPAVRVVAGGAAGLLLMGCGRRLSVLGYRNYGLSIAGAGVVVLYLSVYAALNFYSLLSTPLAFSLLVVISAGAAILADVEVSPSLAVVAVLGGFATPFLVGGQQDAQVVLFTYDALLIAATTFLAFRREWWYLNLISLLLTVVTIGAWAAAYYTDARALRTELFLTLYCTMFLVVLRASRHWTSPDARAGSLALVAAPALYHLASIGILYPHAEAYLAYLILATTVALVVAEQSNMAVLRAIVWLAVTVPLAEWLDVYRTHLAASIVAIVAIYAAYLIAALQALHASEWSPTVDTLLNDANGLAVYAELYILLSGRTPDHLALIATALAAWNGAIAMAVRRWDPVRALHWLGIAATLLAIAIAMKFEGAWIVIMWAMEGAALLAIAMRRGPFAVRVGGWALLLIAAVRWIGPDIQRADVSALVLLNARALSGLLLVALGYALAILEAPQHRTRHVERAALFVGASALMVAIVSREIDTYWTIKAAEGAANEIARQAMLSAAWALSAAVALAFGMRRHYRPIRYFAIALFAVTLLKVFVVDLDTLAGLDRIIAFLVVGVVLLFASFLYQRGRATS